MRNLLLVLLTSLPFTSDASHILGGTIMYDHLGGSSYHLKVRLYKDCSSAAFPTSLIVMIRDSAGNQFSPSKDVAIQFDSSSNVPSYLPVCSGNPSVCTEEAFYDTIVSNLPAQPGGYHIYYQYCCRNASLLNITNPLTAGMSLYTYIPDQNIAGSNSSPQWNVRPPLFVCQGNPMNYDHGAYDADGDSLVYSYYTPYSDPNPTFPSNVATFTPVNWVAGYGANNPCGGANLTMNNAGFITGVPQNLGLYQYGVRCEEYRNGVKIAEILRDYPFDVVVCQLGPVANFTAPQVTCYHDYVQFTNTSMNATNYHWDFGDPSTNADTANIANPSWQYASAGTYTVTLIADPNTTCADTTYQVITVEQVSAAFTSSLIAGLSYQFTDNSVTSDGAPIVTWDWNFSSSPTSTSQNPTHTFPGPGTYDVTLIVLSANGCLDTFVLNNFNVNPFSIQEHAAPLNISVFPQPNNGHFTIEWNDVHETSIVITDLTGRKVLEKKFTGETKAEIDLNECDGVYFLRVENEGRVSVQKIILE